MYCMYICALDIKNRNMSLIPLPMNCFSPSWESRKQDADGHLRQRHTWQRSGDAQWYTSQEWRNRTTGNPWRRERGKVTGSSLNFQNSVQSSDLELTEKYQWLQYTSCVRRNPFTNNKKKFIFNETLKYPGRRQLVKVLMHPLCYTLCLSMLWCTLDHGRGLHASISNKGHSTQQ